MKRPIMSPEEHWEYMKNFGKSLSERPDPKRPDETRDYGEYKKKLDALRGSLAPSYDKWKKLKGRAIKKKMK